MNRFICIHGHFYQPPRENAWLEEIEVQDSAAPYHDWNERVSAECYAPNSASRILDTRDRIVDIVNNYASISFDAGPTLLSWMESASPETYRAILEADKEARARFRGHGTAMAQAYNHIIMPLATSRDKRTQVVWGMRDFESRFGRKPEGMWLPETAVDLESLDIMAGEGILFTVLAPHQASQVRPLGGGEWRDASRGRIDPKKPYLCRLPSGRTIALFFYDGPISHDLAFGNLLRNGELFAKRLVAAFSAEDGRPELVHIATDGETYGHHHRFGDMALAYALHYLEKNKLAEITVYGDYLERFPPADEVKIVENTSWSCGHGVERWRSDCGDSSGAHPGWNQKWRTPLRNAMDWLGAKAAADLRDGPGRLRAGPVGGPGRLHPGRPRPVARVRRILLRPAHRAPLSRAGQDHGPQAPRDGAARDAHLRERRLVLRRHLQRRDRPGHAVRRAGPCSSSATSAASTSSPSTSRILEEARSNVPRHKNGAVVYETLVRPAIVDFLRLGAHFAVSSLFEVYPQAVKIAHYDGGRCRSAKRWRPGRGSSPWGRSGCGRTSPGRSGPSITPSSISATRTSRRVSGTMTGTPLTGPCAGRSARPSARATWRRSSA